MLQLRDIYESFSIMRLNCQLLLKGYDCCCYVDKAGSGSAYKTVGRTASGSSGDFSSDAHDTEQQSPATLCAFTDKPATDNTATSESTAKKCGFFDTLDWQDAASVPPAASAGTNRKKTDRVQQMAAFEMGSASLDEDFADFSALRISANTNVTDSLSVAVEPEHISDTEKSNAETATADLLSASAWNDTEGPKDLFDVGAPEPTNFDLLVGPGILGNTNGNSSSGFDLVNSDQPFVADFDAGTESSNNPFTVQDTCTATDNSVLNDMAADLFGTFDPFLGAAVEEKPLSSSNKPSKADGQTDDFFAYMEGTSTVGSGKDDGPDLIGGWNASNILSGVNLNMPRASSRPDLGSTTAGVRSEVPRASSSQNMSSKAYVTANGSTRGSVATDPFADIG